MLDFGAPITLELAMSPEERSKGLSRRESIPPGTGMAFFLPDLRPSDVCFWMRDTWVALDAAFIDSEGRVLKIATMAPRSERPHCPPEPATWVIEAPARWFAGRGVGVGASIGEDNLGILRAAAAKRQGE